MKQHSRITPRLIRLRDAPRYLGMDRTEHLRRLLSDLILSFVAMNEEKVAIVDDF